MSILFHPASDYEADIIRAALTADIPDDPRRFQVSAFCESLGFCRHSYYRYLVPKLALVNIARQRNHLPPIPAPKTYDHRRHLQNQWRLRHQDYDPSSHFSPPPRVKPDKIPPRYPLPPPNPIPPFPAPP